MSGRKLETFVGRRPLERLREEGWAGGDLWPIIDTLSTDNPPEVVRRWFVAMNPQLAYNSPIAYLLDGRWDSVLNAAESFAANPNQSHEEK